MIISFCGGVFVAEVARSEPSAGLGGIVRVLQRSVAHQSQDKHCRILSDLEDLGDPHGMSKKYYYVCVYASLLGKPCYHTPTSHAVSILGPFPPCTFLYLEALPFEMLPTELTGWRCLAVGCNR